MATTRKISPKAQAKAIDTRIQAAYGRTCEGIQIGIMDITKVFAHGKAAIERGADDTQLDRDIRAFVETIRLN